MSGKRINNKLIYLLSLLVIYGYSQSNIPPNIDAEGFQPYCPQESIPIVTSFTIEDPDDSEIESIFIQITSGYVIGQDELELIGFHPNITASWSMTEGRLTLGSAVPGTNVQYADLIAAVYDVVFSTTSPTASGDREFTFSVGDVNFLPATGHYYEFISQPGISWTDALALAETYTYFGLQGYLATVTSQEEVTITGEQAPGTGWIGGSDRNQEGTWIWESGPEQGTVFWQGNADGNSPNFAYWNNGEPNDLNGEDYAHVTPPTIGIFGSWNDLPNINTNSADPYYPQGFIVEYGGMPGDPELDLAASTSIYIPEIINTIDNSRCGPGVLTLEAETSEGDVMWFETETGGTPVFTGNTFTTPFLDVSKVYYVSASINGCITGQRSPVFATIDPIPNVFPEFTLINCDEDGTADGFTDFNLDELEDLLQTDNSGGLDYTHHLSISDAEAGLNAITPTAPFNNSLSSVIYTRAEFPQGCYSISEVTLVATLGSLPPGLEYNLEVCDTDELNDGITVVDLTEAEQWFLDNFPPGQDITIEFFECETDALLETNPIEADNYTNSNPFTQLLYVRVENELNGNCIGIGQNLTINVLTTPEFELNESEILCLNSGNGVELSVFITNGQYDYEWYDSSGNLIGTGQSIVVFEPGNYDCVAISADGCPSTTESITVIESDVAQIDIDSILIEDFSNSNSISLEGLNLGPGDYEFALDSEIGPYAEIPVFTNVSVGEHLIYIRDKNGCGTTVVSVSVMGFPRFFSPNEDGFNDDWNVKGWPGRFTGASTIKIFDRYGKLLKEFSPQSGGWDGSFNGFALPQSDYWFLAEFLRNDGSAVLYRGHFTLRR